MKELATLENALKYLRVKKRISRKKIAQEVGCTEQTLYLCETGKFGSRKFEKEIMGFAKENGF